MTVNGVSLELVKISHHPSTAKNGANNAGYLPSSSGLPPIAAVFTVTLRSTAKRGR